MSTRGDISKDFSPIEIGNIKPERLLGLRTEVNSDGGHVDFNLHFTNLHPFKLRLDPSEMALIFSEIHRASTLMINRQRFRFRCSSVLLEIIETALRPETLDAVIDPTNLDRVLLFQFADHAPIAIRLSAAEVALARVRSDSAAAAILH